MSETIWESLAVTGLIFIFVSFPESSFHCIVNPVHVRRNEKPGEKSQLTSKRKSRDYFPSISLRSLALHAAITVIGVVYQLVSLIFGESSSSKEESAASGLTGKPPEQSQFQGGMGKIFHTRLKPNGFVQHALVVREALETRFSVISPHAASSDATEWKVSVREMHDGIIYATAPKGHFAQNFFPGVPVIREHIKG